jgi:hypothetical protein
VLGAVAGSIAGGKKTGKAAKIMDTTMLGADEGRRVTGGGRGGKSRE